MSEEGRLKNNKHFDKIYKTGQVVFSDDKKLKAIYIYNKCVEKGNILFAPAINKKAGTSVWRNRIKRLLKESYRLHKHTLYTQCLNNNILLELVISPNSINQANYKNLKLDDIQLEIIFLLDKINAYIFKQKQ